MIRKYFAALFASVLAFCIPAVVCADVQYNDYDLGVYYFHSDIVDSGIVPVYIMNTTPYTLTRTEGMITNWYMPDAVAPKSMGVGFFNYSKIMAVTYRKDPHFDESYSYSVLDGKGEPSARFIIHLQNYNKYIPSSSSEKTGIGEYIKLGVDAITKIGGLAPGFGEYFKAAEKVFDLTFKLISFIPKQSTDWYMMSYFMTSVPGKACTPAFVWNSDYCSDSAYNKNCTANDKCGTNKNLFCPSFDSAYVYTGQSCKDDNGNYDSSIAYGIGVAGHSGKVSPFYVDDWSIKQASYGPSYSITVWRSSDYNALYALSAVERMGARAVSAGNTKLQKLFGYVQQKDFQKLRTEFEQLGPQKTSEINLFIRNVSDLPPGPLPAEMDNKLDQILETLKI